MTMDKSAIEQLQQADAIAKANAEVPESIEAMVIVPGNFERHDLESLMPNRRSYRGIFSTAIIYDFSEYVTNNSQEGMACFVDPDTMSAKTVFDLLVDGKPGHGYHTANISLEKTPEYKELLDINNDAVDQQTMAEFIEDHIDYFTFLDASGTEINRTKAITAIRKIDIEAVSKSSSEVGDYHAERSALETVKADSDGNLPASIEYTCIPYESLSEYTFLCRLAISQGRNGGVQLRLSIRALESKKAEMAEEFATKISESLPASDMKIYRGKFRY